jgi:hypothetical protein
MSHHICLTFQLGYLAIVASERVCAAVIQLLGGEFQEGASLRATQAAIYLLELNRAATDELREQMTLQERDAKKEWETKERKLLEEIRTLAESMEAKIACVELARHNFELITKFRRDLVTNPNLLENAPCPDPRQHELWDKHKVRKSEFCLTAFDCVRANLASQNCWTALLLVSETSKKLREMLFTGFVLASQDSDYKNLNPTSKNYVEVVPRGEKRKVAYNVRVPEGDSICQLMMDSLDIPHVNDSDMGSVLTSCPSLYTKLVAPEGYNSKFYSIAGKVVGIARNGPKNSKVPVVKIQPGALPIRIDPDVTIEAGSVYECAILSRGSSNEWYYPSKACVVYRNEVDEICVRFTHLDYYIDREKPQNFNKPLVLRLENNGQGIVVINR